MLVAAAVLPVVPFSHFLPLLAPLGLLPAAAPPAIPATSAGAAALPAAAGPPATAKNLRNLFIVKSYLRFYALFIL